MSNQIGGYHHRPPTKSHHPFISAQNRPPSPPDNGQKQQQYDGIFRIVIITTGSVASIKIPNIVGALCVDPNIQIQIVATQSSTHFYTQSDIDKAVHEAYNLPYNASPLSSSLSSASASASSPSSSPLFSSTTATSISTTAINETPRSIGQTGSTVVPELDNSASRSASSQTSVESVKHDRAGRGDQRGNIDMLDHDQDRSRPNADSGMRSGTTTGTLRLTNTEAEIGVKIWTDADEWSDWKKIGDPILHIELRRWADLIVIAPCSADFLAKLAAGFSDNLALSLLRATPPTTPVILCPAMNTQMYLHPFTAKHLLVVQEELGYLVLGPQGTGTLACGDDGPGKMTAFPEIVEEIQNLASVFHSRHVVFHPIRPLDPSKTMSFSSQEKGRNVSPSEELDG